MPDNLWLQHPLEEHLMWWGLRRVDSDAAYDRWQAETIPAADLRRLQHLATQKSRDPLSAANETAFYDCAAAPAILPILYSQRYGFYLAVGPLIAERLAGAARVLDFGCGPGILTTFYARQYPAIDFVGIDRSEASLAAARAHAGELGLKNIRFDSLDADAGKVPSRYDVIIATHAVLQAERDPGLPSRTWRTFERDTDRNAQRDFEERTGLGRRLDHLCSALAPSGRLLLLEKTHQLGRRIGLRRALTARGFSPVEPPRPVRYACIEEITEDGPLYVLQRKDLRGPHDTDWDDAPEWDSRDLLYLCPGMQSAYVKGRLPGLSSMHTELIRDADRGDVAMEWGVWHGGAYVELISAGGSSTLLIGPSEAIEGLRLDPAVMTTVARGAAPEDRGETDLSGLPLYENHTPGAQSVWESLEHRHVLKETTREEAGGRQMHAELGSTGELTYLYCANTFDQRQLVIVERERAAVVAEYYDEIVNQREESPS